MLRFQVSGMTCGHCVRAVTKAVQSVDPGAAVDIDLGTGQVTVRGAADAAVVTTAIQAAGYEVSRRTAEA